jgi:hypothetical protein
MGRASTEISSKITSINGKKLPAHRKTKEYIPEIAQVFSIITMRKNVIVARKK